MDIQSLLERLDLPRENGTPGLAQAQAVLDSCLHAADLAPEMRTFSCHLGRADAAAVVLALAALLLVGAAWRSRWLLGGVGLALCLAAAAGVGGLDRLLPVATQANLEVAVQPLAPALREVLLTAHYDSKTEPLDHAGRVVLFAGAALAVATAAWLAWRRRGPRRRAAAAGALALLATAAQLSLGRLLPQRSHGIVDDAAACALLVELAAELGAQPLSCTRVRFVWFAGEEVGSQGSAALAPALSREATTFINLEAIGAGPELAYVALETHGGRLDAASPEVVATLDACRAEPLRRLRVPLWTDAGPLRRAGLPGLTLLTLPRGAGAVTGLHGAADRLERLDANGYAATFQLLQTYLARVDAAAVAGPLRRP